MWRKKSRVFVGPLNLANLSNAIVEALKGEGINARFYQYGNFEQPFNYKKGKVVYKFKNGFFPKLFNKNTTALINRLIINLIFPYWLIKYNTFIFISPRSFLHNNLDLPILRFFSKKVFFIFAGCVERDPAYQHDNPEYICNRCLDEEKKAMAFCYKIEKKKAFVQKLEKYSTKIISQDDCASFLKNKNIVWLIVPGQIPKRKNYLKKFEENKIRIVHFPSNPLVKMSHIIMPVLEQLDEKYDNVEIIYKTGIPNDEVLGELERNHILVDCLGLGYGALGIEAMARGCIIFTGKTGFIENKFPDLPVICSTSQSLLADLENIIQDKEKRMQLSIKSMEFYKKYHSPDKIGKYYKEELDLH
jgi:hypothetical protein